MNHQDWTPVIMRKSTKQIKKDGQQKTTPVKNNNQSNSNFTRCVNSKKLEENDVGRIETVSHKLSVCIMQSRNKKKFTQKDLASKLGVNVKIIQSYENGTAVPNGMELSKMSRILGVKLKK
jgi:ribosome-binding protein aMBF1 (putative translation factor)